MDDQEVGRYWEANAPAWTKLSRAGYDVYRDWMNTPAFMEMLPEVAGLRGLDIGCGEGHNTRLLAGRGAKMIGIDIAPSFIAAARQAEADEPLGIEYRVASGTDLPFADEAFDFATAFMSLMDMADSPAAVREAWRVLAAGGFFQFSIIHPCFFTRHWGWLRDEAGKRYAVKVGGYFDPPQGQIEEWIFGAAPPEVREGLARFRVPRFFHTLSDWMNTLIDAGFAIERMNEPCADDQTARRQPDVADTRIVAFFLHVRCRKPPST
ncbi:MAG TPA: methyltransferase domain-containing protein [Phycisphaerae bacterium]|nr:methyltransferase domain-containing protein [Phycisphaerae bacterium]